MHSIWARLWSLTLWGQKAPIEIYMSVFTKWEPTWMKSTKDMTTETTKIKMRLFLQGCTCKSRSRCRKGQNPSRIWTKTLRISSSKGNDNLRMTHIYATWTLAFNRRFQSCPAFLDQGPEETWNRSTSLTQRVSSKIRLAPVLTQISLRSWKVISAWRRSRPTSNNSWSNKNVTKKGYLRRK